MQAYSHTNKSKSTGVGATPQNPMGIEKTKLLSCESVYWFNINVDIEKYIKTVLHVLVSADTAEGKDHLP